MSSNEPRLSCAVARGAKAVVASVREAQNVHGPFRRQARKCWKKKHALVVGVCDNENNNIFIGLCH